MFCPPLGRLRLEAAEVIRSDRREGMDFRQLEEDPKNSFYDQGESAGIDEARRTSFMLS